MRIRRGASAIALLLCTAPLVACQASALVVLSLRPSGSGSVGVSLVLDREAAARVGDLNAALRVDDLRRTGWVLDPIATGSDGSVTALLHHSFANPAEATRLLSALGPTHVTVTRHKGLMASTLGVTGDVDLAAGVDTFGDPALVKALGVTSIGDALKQVKDAGGTTPDVHVSVAAQLPAHPSAISGGGVVHGDTVTWSVPLGQRAALAATAHATDRVAEEWLTAAVSLVVALVVVVVVSARRARSRRHRDRWSLPRG
jgi:hypothetical protein